MSDDVDLAIGLSWDQQRKALYGNLRLDRKGTATDEWEPVEEPIDIDLDRLRDLETDPERYGEVLGEILLRQQDIGPFYRRARQSVEGGQAALHVRLHLSAPAQYNAVRWETLRDPETTHRLALDSRVLLSRYLSSAYWNPVPQRPKHVLRGLVVVSAPTNVADYEPNGQPLAEVDLDAELERARSALAEVNDLVVLTEGDAGIQALLNAVDKGVDVLYLVCHGALRKGIPQLYLEDSDRMVDVVDGHILAERIAGLEHQPTVAMLCSCQSAAAGDELWTADDGALSALGPRLAQAGVAAVVAMQGRFSMQSAATFLPEFFKRLEEHGEVDRAMAAARRAIAERPDWWAPVLFSRLRSGRTYYRPGFTEEADVTWEALRLALRTGGFTPVLGSGLADSILGSRQDVAGRWAERWQMPLTTPNRGDLAQVAQFLRVRNTEGIVRDQFMDHLASEIARRRESAEEGDPFWNLDFDRGDLEPAILEVGRRMREADENDPYRVAAAMPVSVYVTTGWTELLQEALKDAGKQPDTIRFGWDQAVDRRPRKRFRPSVEQPLVYHLFGHLDERASLVLSEDDYFAWFTAWLQKGENVPDVVQGALTNNSLVFLGFQLDDWDFRVVLNAIKSFGGSALMSKHQHAGVQISPTGSLIESDSAQEYLESRFGVDKVDIYWGETAGFLAEFRARTGLET